MLSIKDSCVVWETGVNSRTTRSPKFNVQNLSYCFYLISLSNNENFILIFHTEPVAPMTESFDATIMLKSNSDKRYYGVGSCRKCQDFKKIMWKFSRIDAMRNPCYELGPAYFYVKVILYSQGQDNQYCKENLGEIITNIPPNLSSLSRDIGGLLKDDAFMDAKLKCGDRLIPAHRCVLAARSEVFAAMFCSDMEERKTGVVDITDLDAEVADTFLEYLYNGQVPEVPDDIVPSLYVAADKYAVIALKNSCRERMLGNLQESNCMSHLILADTHCDADFKKAAVAFICGHKHVLKSEEWRNFSDQFLKLSNEVYQHFIQSQS